MKIEALKQASKDFLRTYNYGSKEVGNGKAIVFSRPTGMGFADELLVYFQDKGETLNEDDLKKLALEFNRIPGGGEETGRKFFLSNGPLGLVSPSVTEHGFKYQVPVQFFDREFSPKSATPLKVLEKRALETQSTRIPQPYSKVRSSEDLGGGRTDLLDELAFDIENAKQPAIRIIIAPAGYGKTVLMSNLYLQLLDKFKKFKQGQQSGRRPLMMLPGHIKRAEDMNSLINNFVGDEYDYGYVSNETFKFWVNQGLAVWLLDGLEELILRIPDPEDLILQLLEDFIYAPNVENAQIVISIRKPLLSITPALKEVINEWKGVGIVTYDLTDWGSEQVHQYISTNLPASEEEQEEFAETIKNTPTLNGLCRVPYYCDLITQLKKNDQLKVFYDDIELIKYSIESICDREFGKGLDKDVFPVEKQIDFFSTIAVEGFKQKQNLLPIEDFLQWAHIDLSDYTDDVREEQLACIKRHSVLLPFGNYIDFLQDIIKDFFLARGLAHELRSGNIVSLENGDLEIGNFPFRYLLKESDSFNWNKIFSQIWQVESSASSTASAFRNLLKIYLLSNQTNKESRLGGLLNSKNLSGIEFRELALQKTNFEDSILTGVKFIQCNLENASFDRSQFKETTFTLETNIHGATTRGAVLESIYDGDALLRIQKDIRNFFEARTMIETPANLNVPCQAVINLKKVLEKFTRRKRGHRIRTNFISWDVSAQSATELALKYGFLAYYHNQQYMQVKNSYFDSLTKFCRKFEMTPELTKCLDELCPDTGHGCTHTIKIS